MSLDFSFFGNLRKIRAISKKLYMANYHFLVYGADTNNPEILQTVSPCF